MKTKTSPKRKTASTQPKRKEQRKAPAIKKASQRSLQDVVGSAVYQTWVQMLHALVPEGRTHRLAPLVAAMLHYALVAAEDRRDEDTSDNSVGQSLMDSTEAFETETVKKLLHDVVTQLFEDARVAFNRTNARGEPYSIADEAYSEYVHWSDMPWE